MSLENIDSSQTWLHLLGNGSGFLQWLIVSVIEVVAFFIDVYVLSHSLSSWSLLSSKMSGESSSNCSRYYDFFILFICFPFLSGPMHCLLLPRCNGPYFVKLKIFYLGFFQVLLRSEYGMIKSLRMIRLGFNYDLTRFN